MGRLSEYFRFLETDPKDLTEFKQSSVYTTFNDNDTKIRREYRKSKKQNKKDGNNNEI